MYVLIDVLLFFLPFLFCSSHDLMTNFSVVFEFLFLFFCVFIYFKFFGLQLP